MKNNISAIIDKVFQNRWLSHVLFWLFVIFSYPLFALAFKQPIFASLIIKLAFLPAQIMAAYLLIYYQIPHLLLKKKYPLFFLSFLLSAYVFSGLAHLSDDYIVIPWLTPNQEQHSLGEIFLPFNDAPTIYIIWVYLIPMIMASIKLVKQEYVGKQKFETLQKEKAQAELNLLKAQIHPRFLSNTLHHLYQLSLQKSDEAPEVIIKLSDMLDYMLYRANTPKVSLSKEVELIQNFLDLEFLRHEKQLKVSFDPKIENQEMKIAPLLLLSIVENAFGFPQNGKGETFRVQILLKAKENQLHFAISNTQSRDSSKEKNKEGEKDIRRQLSLLYPDQHQLVIEKTPHFYQANLTLQL